MDDTTRVLQEHVSLTRRYFLKLGGVASAVLSLPAFRALSAEEPGTLAEVISALEYLTRPEDFGTVERGDPLPYKLPKEKRLEVGLERETWQLEVVADPDTDAELANPMSKELGTALDWNGLMKLAETRAVRYIKMMTCLNVGEPLGTGMWEGVPLRDVIWMAKPVSNVRRVFYYGYHNDDPEQRFQSSLAIGRVLEDPPGEYPVLLCYKLNGKWLSGKRGGPARVLVPDAYGFKSVKWLQRVVLTNRFNANDTYADGNNDVDTKMKTYARFVFHPKKVKSGQPIPLTGLAQVGMSGLRKVQYCVLPADSEWPKDDPHFTKADWRDADLLPPPKSWGGGLGAELPPMPSQFDAAGKPLRWPLRYAKVHWAALAPGIGAGKYLVRCRTIDVRGEAQPMPRPFVKSGRNRIQSVELSVEA